MYRSAGTRSVSARRIAGGAASGPAHHHRYHAAGCCRRERGATERARSGAAGVSHYNTCSCPGMCYIARRRFLILNWGWSPAAGEDGAGVTFVQSVVDWVPVFGSRERLFEDRIGHRYLCEVEPLSLQTWLVLLCTHCSSSWEWMLGPQRRASQSFLCGPVPSLAV